MDKQPYHVEAPPIIATPPRRQIGWWLTALAIGAAGVVLFLFNPAQHGFYPRCALYVTTGLYCPGCGALRATHQLVHGHLLTALHYNPLLVLSLPFVGYFFSQRVLGWMRNKPAPPFVLRPKWIVALGIVLVVFTILRNIRIAPFTWLAPP